MSTEHLFKEIHESHSYFTIIIYDTILYIVALTAGLFN